MEESKMPSGSRLETASITLLALCAATVTIIMLRREFITPLDPGAPEPPTAIKDWNSYGVGDMRIGPPNAPVTIVEFSDFECPACGQLFPVLHNVLEKHPDEVRLVYRNFPLSRIHAHARAAAVAGECAAFQGRFQQYHNLLFQNQDSLGKIAWTTLATRAGVQDKGAFEACMTSDVPATKLRADSLAGVSLHLLGTPTVLVNKWMLREPPTDDVLERLINQELAAVRKEGGKALQ
jgi:protein-disulfide isomerase